MGARHGQDAEYLDACRNKRNIAEYDYAGGVTGYDVSELVDYVSGLRSEVLRWLRANHPEFI